MPARAVPISGKSGSPKARSAGLDVPIGIMGFVLIGMPLLSGDANHQGCDHVLGILELVSGRIHKEFGRKCDAAGRIDLGRVLAEQDLANHQIAGRSSTLDAVSGWHATTV